LSWWSFGMVRPPIMAFLQEIYRCGRLRKQF
jgi:hypothetical protein